MGAAYGTAKSALGICSMGVLHPDQVMRNSIPIVMAGVLGVYGELLYKLNRNYDSKLTIFASF